MQTHWVAFLSRTHNIDPSAGIPSVPNDHEYTNDTSQARTTNDDDPQYAEGPAGGKQE